MDKRKLNLLSNIDSDGLALAYDRCVNRLRNTDMDKFQSMCKIHLSFLLDLPGQSLEELMDSQLETGTIPQQKTKKFGPFSWKKGKLQKSSATLNEDSVKEVIRLVEYLEKPNNINQEGLFRKIGQLTRQKSLKDQLFNGTPLDLESGEYSAHDCANVLKAYLGNIQEPLLTEKHYRAHCQVAEMSTPNMSDADARRTKEKQIRTIQLLLLLLPSENYSVLKNVVNFLHRVANVEENRMTASNLGTVFAPHVLCPRKMTAFELHAASKVMSKSMTFIIENAQELFKVPTTLAQDIFMYWQKMEQGPPSLSGAKDTPKAGSVRKYKKYFKTSTPNPVRKFMNKCRVNSDSVCVVDYQESPKKRRATERNHISYLESSCISLTPIHEATYRTIDEPVQKPDLELKSFLSPSQRKRLNMEQVMITPRSYTPLSVFWPSLLLDDSITSEDPCAVCF